MKNLLIIGASGFIGSYLLDELKNEGIKIIAVSLNLSDFLIKLDSENIIYEDYETFKQRKEKLTDYTVINLAYTRSNDAELVEDSKKFTYEITEYINKLEIKKYIYISTQSVYNEERVEAAKEDDSLLPKNVYGQGKVDLEKWLTNFSLKNNITLSILRLGSVVGPGMEARITSRFVKDAVEKGQIQIQDSGQIFSYIHIEDLVQGLKNFIEIFNSNQDDLFDNVSIFNLGTEEIYSLTDVAKEIKEQLKNIYNRDINIIISNIDGAYKNNSINMNKFFAISSWRPKYNLENIIKDEIDRLMNKLND